MRARIGPLLAELHVHTMWSDGAFSVSQLVDIYGERGFDVLCITDHACRPDDPWLEPSERHERGVGPGLFDDYLADIDREAERARRRYGLLLLPGLELTWNDLDPDHAAHALAVGLRRFTPLTAGIESALAAAAAAGAAIVAAHPYAAEAAPSPARLTRRFARDHERLAPLVHRWELFNRTTLFSWVAAAGLPAVATGDFHRLEHLSGWKTLIPCAREERAVVRYLRSRRPVYLARLGDEPERLAA
jgi:predicted metal-dependent phosphoesterase TrpH